MKRVAVCSYWYPPTRTIASLRVGKFVKYLPQFGWEPFVFTVAPVTDRYMRAGTLPDEGLPDHVNRVPDPSTHAIVDRVWPDTDASSGSPVVPDRWRWVRRMAKRLYDEAFRFPDEAWPWLLHYGRLREAVARVEPELIFSSSPPATVHLIARRLSNDLGVPWVADLRDPWSHNEHLSHSSLYRAAEWRLERRTLAGAQMLTTVSARLCELLQDLHDAPVCAIPNGFEPYPSAPVPAPEPATDGCAVLVYTGLLYEASAVPLCFEAIERLLASGRVRASQVSVRFYGRNQRVAAEALQRYPRLRDVVELHGEVSYSRAQAVQQAASALLLLDPPTEWAKRFTPGKLFEYIGARRPIIATALRGGEIDSILRETRTGAVAPTVDALADAIAQLVEQVSKGETPMPDVDHASIARYTRWAVTGRLARVFDDVAGLTQAAVAGRTSR